MAYSQCKICGEWYPEEEMYCDGVCIHCKAEEQYYAVYDDV